MPKNLFYKREKEIKQDVIPEQNGYSSGKELDILDELISGSYKNKKKKKKNKYKEKDKDKKKKKKKGKSKDKDKKKKVKMLDLKDVVDVDKEKVEKENEDFYEYRFNSSLVLLRELLKQTNGELIDGKNTLEEFKKARGARGSFTAITNQSSNITSLISTKLNIIKEITNVNKSISDLENKRLDRVAKANAAKGANADGQSDEQILDGLLNKIAEIDASIYDGKDGEDTSSKKKKKKSKKNKSKEDLDELDDMIDNDDDEDTDVTTPFNEDDDDDDDFYDDVEEDEKQEKSDKIDFDEDDDIDSILAKRAKKLEKKGLIKYSDNEKAFKYEKSNIEVVVVKSSPESTRWRFVAVDDEGDEVFDYPLPPDKSTKGKMKFNYEKGIAKDKLDNSYRIVYDVKLASDYE